MDRLQDSFGHASVSSLGWGSVPSDPYPGFYDKCDEQSLDDRDRGGHDAPSEEPEQLKSASKSPPFEEGALVSRISSMPSLAPIKCSEHSIPSLATILCPEARKLGDEDSCYWWYDDLDEDEDPSSKPPDGFHDSAMAASYQYIQSIYEAPKKSPEMRWKDQASQHDFMPFSPRRRSCNDVELFDSISSPVDVFSFSDHNNNVPPMNTTGDTPPKAPRRGGCDYERPKRRASLDGFPTSPMRFEGLTLDDELSKNERALVRNS